MDNPYRILMQQLIEYFVQFDSTNRISSVKNASNLIRIHKERLSKFGEVSFPCQKSLWSYYLQHFGDKLIEKAFELFNPSINLEEKEYFLKKASQWFPLPLKNLNIQNNRCHLYIERVVTIKQIIIQILNDPSYGYLKKSQHKVLLKTIAFKEIENLSQYRTSLLYHTLQKLLPYSKWIIANSEANINDNDITYIEVQSVQSNEIKSISYDDSNRMLPNYVLIKCGLVMDTSKQGKVCKLSVDDYFSLRSNDVRLIALHKYSLRMKNNDESRNLINQLGKAAVTVDLLEVKHTSPVRISRCGQGTTKGSSFILYNSARLETLLRTFETDNQRGAYQSIPPLKDINWELLNEQEEWQLVYVYLLGFPNLIENCLEHLEQGLCRIHLIIKFLNGLASLFSAYYRRVRILKVQHGHMMISVYARIALIKAVRVIFNKTLALLDLEPVAFM